MNKTDNVMYFQKNLLDNVLLHITNDSFINLQFKYTKITAILLVARTRWALR